MNCPRCGKFLDKDLDVCLNCGYQNRKKQSLCPECGEPLVRGVCYRCGYRKKRSNNTCPYCKQKLIKGFCERCNYKQGEGAGLFILFVLIPLIIFICGIVF